MQCGGQRFTTAPPRAPLGQACWFTVAISSPSPKEPTARIYLASPDQDPQQEDRQASTPTALLGSSSQRRAMPGHHLRRPAPGQCRDGVIDGPRICHACLNPYARPARDAFGGHGAV